MTLESQNNINRYVGNGSTKTFSFSFKVWGKEQVKVFVGDGLIDEDVSTSVDVEITDTGGSVTFQEPPASNQIIVIRRSMPYTQEDNYTNGTRFNPEEIEDRFDQDCAERQDLALGLSRSVKMPETSSVSGDQLVSELLHTRQDVLDALEESGSVAAATRVAASNSSTLRTLAERFADFPNAKDFGAVADGGVSSGTAADDRPVLFLCAGSSSMSGYAETTSGGSISVSGAYYWNFDNGSWATPVRDPMWSGNRGGIVPAMAQKLKAAIPNRTLLFVNAGDGGSTISSQDYLNSDGNWSRLGWSSSRMRVMVANALQAWTSSSEVIFGGIVWWGGGNDAAKVVSGQVTVAAYKTSFAGLLDSLHSQFDCKFYYIRFCRAPSESSNADKWQALADLRAAQLEVVSDRAWAVECCNPTEYDSDASAWTGYGGTHLGQTACNAIGAEVGENIGADIALPSTKATRTATGTDNASAFAAFEASTGGMKYIPRGTYRIGDKTYTWDHGRLGNGVDSSSFGFFSGLQFDRGDGSVLAVGESKTRLLPMIALSTDVDTDEIIVGQETTRPVGLYVEHRQTGGGNGFTHSIMGYGVNAGTGDNDVVGVSGRVSKESAAGPGDACGVWGSAYQNSSRDIGGVMGLEGHIYQNVQGTAPQNNFPGAWSAACHLFSGSTGDPASNALQIDAGMYGFWNAISIDRSCFKTRSGGKGAAGTVAINCGSWLTAHGYPETGILFGMAVNHVSMYGIIPFNVKAYNTQFHQEGEVNLNIVSDETANGGHGFQQVCFYLRDSETAGNSTKMASVRSYNNGQLWLLSHYRSGEAVSGELGIWMGGNSTFEEFFVPCSNNKMVLGSSGKQWKDAYIASGSINTSDERLKENIEDPDEALMRAWGKISYKVFQFKDALESKGENARIHIGVIAQQIAEAFASEGLDANRYGLFCYDEWDAEYQDVEVVDAEEVVGEDGSVVTPRQTHFEHKCILEAGNRYGIRYSEALALECAYQRWRLEQIEARLAALEVQ